MGEMADDIIDNGYDDYFDDYGMEDDYISRSLSSLNVRGHQKHGADGQPVQTAKAILWVRLNGEEVWLPYSQIVSAQLDSITITSWLANKRGWTRHNVNEQPEASVSESYDLNDDIPF